jgi:hypothetical protein
MESRRDLGTGLPIEICCRASSLVQGAICSLGLLQSAECDSSITPVYGRGCHGADRWLLAPSSTRRHRMLESLLVRRDELEDSLLKGWSESVLKTEVVGYAVAKVVEALSAQYASLEKRSPIWNSSSTDSIAHGRQSPRVMNGNWRTGRRIARHHRQAPRTHTGIVARKAGRGEGICSVTTLGIGQLEGANENGKRTCLAHGKADSLGEEDWSIPMVPGEGNGSLVRVISSCGWPPRDHASLENRFIPGLRRSG